MLEYIEQMLDTARNDFKEDAEQWDRGECLCCHMKDVPRAQHWNDVGGSGTLMCEGCYIQGIIYFWVSEDETAGTVGQL